jgi:hypothetical protein
MVVSVSEVSARAELANSDIIKQRAATEYVRRLGRSGHRIGTAAI